MEQKEFVRRQEEFIRWQIRVSRLIRTAFVFLLAIVVFSLIVGVPFIQRDLSTHFVTISICVVCITAVTVHVRHVQARLDELVLEQVLLS